MGARTVTLEKLERTLGRLATALRARFGGWRTFRALSVALIPLALAPWLYPQIGKELASPLFRDAVQSQYSGWCLRHGVRLYRGVGAPDGPLIHFLHAFMQLFAGDRDLGCRIADLVIQIAGSAAMGALLAPRVSETRAGLVLQRVAWALFAAALWMTWYLFQGWTQTVQRDGYYALFGYLGLVLVYASETFSPRCARAATLTGSALCALLVFSRQAGVIFPACALLGLLFSGDLPGPLRAARWKAAIVGAVVAVGSVLLALILFGSLRGLWFWYFEYPLTFYRWLSKQNPWHLLTANYLGAAVLAVLTLAGVVLAVARRWVSPRGLMFAFPPVLFLIAACLQGKGWPNHVQQTTAVLVPLCLLVLSKLWNRGGDRLRFGLRQGLGAGGLLLLILGVAYWALHQGPFYAMRYPPTLNHDIAAAEAVGDYLKAHTSPDDTVFLYGHEAHVLLYAERRPTIPYYVNILLNIEVLYQHEPAAPGEEPNAGQRLAMRRLGTEIAADACQRLTSRPPGAMAFLNASMGIFGDGLTEVADLCPALRVLLRARYHRVDFPGGGEYKVYLRTLE